MHLAPPPESFGDEFDSHVSSVQMTAAVSPSAHDPLDDDDDFLDDVFGSGVPAARTSPDMSLDTRRLRAQHHTVGYREGITAGKARSIQAGFDHGFSLGATIGIRAGQLRGLLEGIGAALAHAGHSAHVHDLLSRAAVELSPASVFTSKFWAADGTWTYPVTATRDDGKIVYADVADQHPLIAKWARIARDEADRWHIDPALPILAATTSSARDGDNSNDVSPPETSSKPEITSRAAIEW
ncbi:hypothetical protein F4678DRAFT_454072 [Xylaria arbuscula]|nr:hypothetical protein F4678DRAFT_454072 [Xylaria arbuscula]